jgi:hypothetical protein
LFLSVKRNDSKNRQKLNGEIFMYDKFINAITRRDFVKEVAAGATAAAAVGTEAFAAQSAPKLPKDLEAHAVGEKYSQYLFSGLRDKMSSMLPSMGGDSAYFRGAWQIPGASINMGWQVITKANFMEKEGHHHLVDEYFAIFGAQMPDIWSSFDAVVELCYGPEEEKHIITQPTFVFVPKGMHHCPLNFKVVNKPILFQAIHLGPRFHKIMGGKEYWFEGPGRSIEGWKGHPW